MNIPGHIKHALEAVLEAVLPLPARAKRTKARLAEDIPLSPMTHELLGVRITTLMEYQRSETQDLIRALKYDRSAHAANIAATLLADYLREEVAGEKTFSTKKILIVPVPLHKSRARERGFNQISLVLQALPEEFRPLVADALTRTRATEPQTRLSRSERLSNVAGAFATRDAGAVENAHIFLIDDVTTTGATLANAATPLRRAGARVSLIALARA